MGGFTSISKDNYNRETIDAWNNEIHQMSFIPPFFATHIINPFLNSRILANHDKWRDFELMVKYL